MATHPAPTRPGTLVTRKEIENMFGLSRSAVHRMTAREGFPAPIDDGDDHRHPIWERALVVAWAAANRSAAE